MGHPTDINAVYVLHFDIALRSHLEQEAAAVENWIEADNLGILWYRPEKV